MTNTTITDDTTVRVSWLQKPTMPILRNPFAARSTRFAAPLKAISSESALTTKFRCPLALIPKFFNPDKLVCEETLDRIDRLRKEGVLDLVTHRIGPRSDGGGTPRDAWDAMGDADATRHVREVGMRSAIVSRSKFEKRVREKPLEAP
eukprot:CAMPEP_0118935238 /NCGR_PEP_ID=MMETSP1169-20130426/15240_1 /TAXON_ID=36882 /ORGANISM="Pyramimonas obovata, Strain CCMP722" /LENGTH=147 /DNA_ID=CAMNT_0006878247 /DNA_START=209 /DNA_END=649 /DNA_ORIENTATION=-